MFLNRLNTTEKEAFLKLAHHLARSDSDFSATQQEIIQGYCLEMQVEDIDFDVDTFDIYHVLAVFTSARSRKVVLLEIMALIYADDFMHEEERKVLETLSECFDLSPHLTTIYTQWAKSMLALHLQGNALVEL
ncbi:MAG: TerB family tellurite resistance protein [Ghiorsea sp.]|nr:TerB family tellurite resistance protein [Ghiorsea sp.]